MITGHHCDASQDTDNLTIPLEGLHETPTLDFYQAHKDDFASHVQKPLRDLLLSVVPHLSPALSTILETKRKLFAQIRKNDHGQRGARHWKKFQDVDAPQSELGHSRYDTTRRYIHRTLEERVEMVKALDQR